MTWDRSLETVWLAGIRIGDVSAFDALYRAIVPGLLTFGRRLTPLPLAEDAVQDVMVDLWERRDRLALQGSLRGYLFGAVRLRIADRLRHEQVVDRTAQRLATQATFEMASVAPTQSEQLEASELSEAIERALATLPPKSRLILTLRWMNGMSYPEIATALGMSTDAAKKQGYRMEIVVRKLLADFTNDADS